MQKRLEELKLEARISPLPPVVMGGLLIVPMGLINVMTGAMTEPTAGAKETPAPSRDTQAAAAKARSIIMEIEKNLGYDPIDRETEKLGYDIESRIPNTGKLRFKIGRAHV